MARATRSTAQQDSKETDSPNKSPNSTAKKRKRLSDEHTDEPPAKQSRQHTADPNSTGDVEVLLDATTAQRILDILEM